MKLISCSQCFKNYPSKQTTIVDGKRICHECRSKNSKKGHAFKTIESWEKVIKK